MNKMVNDMKLQATVDAGLEVMALGLFDLHCITIDDSIVLQSDELTESQALTLYEQLKRCVIINNVYSI